MLSGFLNTLWYLWIHNLIQVDVVIKALALEDYELGSITKNGITAFKEGKKFEFRYG